MQEQMVVLYESGLSGQKVADKLGISSSYTVYKYLKKQGVKTRSNRENSKKHHVK
ncbi:helix-turn-helix domain-containing protein, partial [Ligilactobacillus salivarius]|uniref:helix-turn-helix domain-containing protein n=3 Tax=Ligilactobacillus salivarius TaxID=1624 RepID=UPI00117A830F